MPLAHLLGPVRRQRGQRHAGLLVDLGQSRIPGMSAWTPLQIATVRAVAAT